MDIPNRRLPLGRTEVQPRHIGRRPVDYRMTKVVFDRAIPGNEGRSALRRYRDDQKVTDAPPGRRRNVRPSFPERGDAGPGAPPPGPEISRAPLNSAAQRWPQTAAARILSRAARNIPEANTSHSAQPQA